MGFIRIARGQDDACLTMGCNWATPKAWTESNYPCDEGGANCKPAVGLWIDPSLTGVPLAQAVTRAE